MGKGTLIILIVSVVIVVAVVLVIRFLLRIIEDIGAALGAYVPEDPKKEKEEKDNDK